MKDGIYHVRFSSNMQGMGEGIAVFHGSSVNGGDTGYTYSGRKESDGEHFRATLTIKRWNASLQSIFGALDQFQLQFHGQPDGVGFRAEGSIVGQPQAKITVQGRFLVSVS